MHSLARNRLRLPVSRGAFVLCVVWLGAFLLLAGCGREEEKSLSTGEDDGPQQTLHGILLRESEAGKLRWVLRADSARHYGEQDRTILIGVAVDFYDETGDTVRSWLTAQEGEVDPATRNLTARGNVLVRTREEQTLRTEELFWDNETGKVRSDHFVELTDGESVLQGVGIESDPELSEYTLQSHVKGEFYEGEKVPDEESP